MVKSSKITVPWAEGLHARPASKLVNLARRFGSSIQLQCNGKIANARSIVSILLLCATMGASIQIEAIGDDEDQAIQAVEELFDSNER